MKSLIPLIVTTWLLIPNEEAHLTKKFIYRMNLIVYMPSYRYTQSNKYPQGTWNKYQVPPTPPNTKIKQNHTNANYVT